MVFIGVSQKSGIHVIPTKVGIHFPHCWIPACAGMTTCATSSKNPDCETLYHISTARLYVIHYFIIHSKGMPGRHHGMIGFCSTGPTLRAARGIKGAFDLIFTKHLYKSSGKFLEMKKLKGAT